MPTHPADKISSKVNDDGSVRIVRIAMRRTSGMYRSYIARSPCTFAAPLLG
jgi:hypothetical protein